MLLICDASARDLVVCVPMEEMAEELHARFHFSLRKDWCMTVCILTRRPGVRRQPIIIRTGNGATVFLSVSRIIYCGRFNLGRDSHSKGGQLRALIRPCRCHSKIDPKVRVKAPWPTFKTLLQTAYIWEVNSKILMPKRSKPSAHASMTAIILFLCNP